MTLCDEILRLSLRNYRCSFLFHARPFYSKQVELTCARPFDFIAAAE
jgi:hypothetical protein